eukprot:CAMPEP_0171545558 /NCGR_PEP_ID=MMETSP0960-20121227/4143_1 /TAXON_ID=87120 /ORGANISM="Aurantiochytrium limacinum, Strain ATCCMYA-1381" /LENGTH=42 /DNA_ID= /DNA_START= /DNA_END= /DNA_ORIENTATION=
MTKNTQNETVSESKREQKGIESNAYHADQTKTRPTPDQIRSD